MQQMKSMHLAASSSETNNGSVSPVINTANSVTNNKPDCVNSAKIVEDKNSKEEGEKPRVVTVSMNRHERVAGKTEAKPLCKMFNKLAIANMCS